MEAYVFPSCKELIGKKDPQKNINNDQDFVTSLWNTLESQLFRAQLLVEGYFRISYATSDEALDRACSD